MIQFTESDYFHNAQTSWTNQPEFQLAGMKELHGRVKKATFHCRFTVSFTNAPKHQCTLQISMHLTPNLMLFID